MPVFDWAESPGTSGEWQPRVLATQFGDGYEQRQADGLNAVKQVWDVVIDAASTAAASAIEAFIRPGMGWQTFDWTPPRQTVALKWKCTAFSSALTDVVGEHDLRLRFEQVFEP